MNNPGILTGPMGAQFYTAPDGTIVYLNDGTPVDLTGVKLTVGPNRTGHRASLSLADPALLPGQVLITGLYNITPNLVGASVIGLANCGVPLNNSPPTGFLILGQGTASPTESVIVSNPAAVVPDFNDGALIWAIYYPLDYAPPFSQGNPLSEIARRDLELNLVADQPAPMVFGDYDPTQPPLTVNDSAGLFNKVQGGL